MLALGAFQDQTLFERRRRSFTVVGEAFMFVFMFKWLH
jgi:hypothetical protein